MKKTKIITRTVKIENLPQLFKLNMDNYSPEKRFWGQAPKKVERWGRLSESFTRSVMPLYERLLDYMISEEEIIEFSDQEERKAQIKTFATSKYREIWNNLVERALYDKGIISAAADPEFVFHLFSNSDFRKPRKDARGNDVYTFKASSVLTFGSKYNEFSYSISSR